MATLRHGMAMESNFARMWASAGNAANIVRWANELVASAIADEFGLCVRLRGFGRRDTLSAATAQAIHVARLRSEREAAEQIAQQDKRHDLQNHELVHQQRVAQQQRLAEIQDATLANPMDVDHATQRDQAERDAAALREHMRQREENWRQPVVPSPPPAWQAPPIPEMDEGLARLGASARGSLGQAHPRAPADAAAVLPSMPKE